MQFCPAIPLGTALLLAGWLRVAAAAPERPAVDFLSSLLPSPVKSSADGRVLLSGGAMLTDGTSVRVRVTTSAGTSFETTVKVTARRFSCHFPDDFHGAPPLFPMALYLDATDAAAFGGEGMERHQAEAMIVIKGTRQDGPPDLPQVFSDDFIDAAGNKDAAAAQFSRNRVLVNRFLQSRAAGLMRLRRPEFDLVKPDDFAWFKEHASLYDFDHRDRDWTQPLGHRVTRGFWQAVWDRWFNASNNHPWDGNPANKEPQNYRPYTFANDPADMVVLFQLLRRANPVVKDNRRALAGEVLQNILAMQHQGAGNFALPEASGKQEYYTAGAFHYGMFESGEWLTEGKGWFANPGFRDFERGGVFNGRCLWALGESLRADPHGSLSGRIRAAIPLTLRFCLHDALAHGYTRLTKNKRPLWGIPGEHGYLTLGIVAAAEVVPGLPVPMDASKAPLTLREVARDALDALVDIAKPDGTWSGYANVDAVNITALVEGSRILTGDAAAIGWKAAACRAADTWLALTPVPAERNTTGPLFGHRRGSGMTWYLGSEKTPHLSLYMNGLWLHTLAVLHRATGEPRYLERAHAIAAYYCGANPLHVRLLSEIGNVYNQIRDRDADGTGDQLSWDGYPESTAFFQIGLLQLLQP